MLSTSMDSESIGTSHGDWQLDKSHRASVLTPRPMDQERLLNRLERISMLFDDAVRLPGTSIRLGWDAVLGLVPVVGDAATATVSAYFMWEAARLGARKRTLAKMLANVGIDFLVGTIPLVGDLVDIGWRANRKNVRLLLRDLEAQGHLASGQARQRIAKILGRTPRPAIAASPSRMPHYPLLMP